MTEVLCYRAEDGKMFETSEECLDYEYEQKCGTFFRQLKLDCINTKSCVNCCYRKICEHFTEDPSHWEDI